MTDVSTPEAPTGRRTAARRRRIAYLAAAIILIVAGTVAGVVIAGHHPPKRVHVAVVKAKPVTLSSAEFMARWAAVTDGPSTITRGTTETINGVVTPESVVVHVAPGPVWKWIETVDGATTTGTASAAGGITTSTPEKWAPGTPAAIVAADPLKPYVNHLPAAWGADIAPGNLLLAEVRSLASAGPQRVLADPVVTGATASSWTVQFSVVWPYCWEHYPSSAPQCATSSSTAQIPVSVPGKAPGPTVSLGAGGRIPEPTATATVTPTSAGGLLISIAPHAFTLLANPA